jgi:hypothetical protein
METFEALCGVLVGRSVTWEALTPRQWANFPIQAEAEGVGPWVYSVLRAQWPTAMPLAVRSMLAQSYYAQVARSQLYFGELARLAQAWAAPPAISVVLLKGLALGPTLYPNPIVRPSGDVDVLIPREQWAEAVERAKALGYAEHLPSAAPNLRDQVEHGVELRGGPAGQVAVEAHWALVAGEADRRAPPVEWFWARAEPWRPRELAASGLLQLAPTAHWLYLMAHVGLQHRLTPPRLIWLFDLHLLMTHPTAGIDWALIAAQTRAWAWEAALGTVLRHLRRNFDTPLPAELKPFLATAPLRPSASAGNRFIITLNKLRDLPWGMRARLITQLLFPSADYVRQRYQPRPIWLWPLWYGWRWLDVAGEAIKAGWKAMRHRS